jgi:uncharacterized protein (DUF39 family)
MVNPRNCYQNYNVAINRSERPIYTYLGLIKPQMQNLSYCSAGQLSPLLNDPLYQTIGIGSKVWLAGAQGHVYAEGTQHSPTCDRGAGDVPTEGAGTLALTGNMKQMKPEFVRGISLIGYGVSLALGVGVPIPILSPEILRHTTIRDQDILAPVIDYAHDYPQKTGKVICRLSYAELKSGEVEIQGKKVRTGSMSSYSKALEIAHLLKDEIKRGDFLLSQPYRPLPREQGMGALRIVDQNDREVRR